MNEFTAKKLGEVLAFAQVGTETIERGREALETVSTPEKITEVLDDLRNQAERIEAISTEQNMIDVTRAKAEGTGGKLRAMRDMYVGDEWDNATELLEWFSFFEGAAVGHWALVEGAAASSNLSDLQELADDAKDMHEDLLEDVADELEKVGARRAAE